METSEFGSRGKNPIVGTERDRFNRKDGKYEGFSPSQSGLSDTRRTSRNVWVLDCDPDCKPRIL